jgi:hypothetical protein
MLIKLISHNTIIISKLVEIITELKADVRYLQSEIEKLKLDK